MNIPVEGVVGSGADYYAHMGAVDYAQRINTPAQSRPYFERFHAPMVARAQERVADGAIRLLDIACGPAFELDFLADNTDIQLIATDISPDILPAVRERLGSCVLAFASDVNHFAARDEVAEVGLLVNAMVYSPDKMLSSMFAALKPQGECAVNFRLFGNPHNEAFYDHYTNRGGEILDGSLAGFPIKILDYAQCITDEDEPDEQIRQLGQQAYFTSLNDVESLIRSTGFRVLDYQPFHFASPVNPDNEVEVFVLQKPIF